jgi:Holliday junction resolvase RusA-like endonuclease
MSIIVLRERPVGQGSMTPVINWKTKKAWMRHQNGDAINKWRDAIRKACKEAGIERIETGPVVVHALFSIPRPASPTHTYPMGDVDKYLRALLDGLTGTAYTDDSQVVGAYGWKAWGNITVVSIEEGWAPPPDWVANLASQSPSAGQLHLPLVR